MHNEQFQKKNSPQFFTTIAGNAFARIFNFTPNLVALLACEKSPFLQLFAAIKHLTTIKCRPFSINFWGSVICSIVGLFSFGLSVLKRVWATMVEHWNRPTSGQQESIITRKEPLWIHNPLFSNLSLKIWQRNNNHRKLACQWTLQKTRQQCNLRRLDQTWEYNRS